ncbi:hypothetical protein [Bacillus pseudomycoides]|uniref:hypothetical protein n=1 Tax=Bacillus pseudomycoides TaxID=64104 RepID=UPI0011A363D5|nr:hypothetical protein [Bacillus pseudomycoides]
MEGLEGRGGNIGLGGEGNGKGEGVDRVNGCGVGIGGRVGGVLGRGIGFVASIWYRNKEIRKDAEY